MVEFVGPRIPSTRTGPPRKYLTPQVQEELKAQPGTYAAIAQDVPRGAVRAINKHPGFEGATRTVNGKTVLFARYTGEARR